MNNLQLTVLLNAIDKLSAPVKNASQSVNTLSDKLKASKAALKNLENTQNKMRGFSRTSEQIKKSTDIIGKHNKKLEDLRNKVSSLKNQRIDLKVAISEKEREFKSITAGGKVSGRSMQLDFDIRQMQKEYEKLQQTISATNRQITNESNTVKVSRREKAKQLLQLRELNSKLKASGISTKEFAKHETNLAEKIKSTNAAIEKQQAKLDKLNAKANKYAKYRGQVETLKSISSNAQIVGAQSMAAGATITTPVVSTVKDFMSFEDAMLGVVRQVDGLKDKAGNLTPEYDIWKQKIQTLSKELPLTTVQIANMIESAARMNMPKEQLEDFVRMNTQMATAFDVANPDELTENFGKVSKNWNLSIQASKELADSINYLDDNAISKGDAIIGFMNRLGGISAVAKITDKNVAALGSTLMTFGSDESSAANAVSSTFSRLSRATTMKPVKKGLKALGLDANKIQKGMMKDAQGTLMIIIERIKTIPEHLRSAVLTDIVGGNYGDEMLKLVANTEEWRHQIELANSEMAKGSMNREFQTRMKALSANWGIFRNKLFNLNSTIGGTLAPTLHKLIGKAGIIVDKFKNWIDTNQELASKIMIVVLALGGTLTAFGALSLALSFLVYPIARIILGLNYFLKISKVLGISVLWLAKAFKWLALVAIKAFVGIFRVMMANPIIAVIMLIIGGLILLWRNWDKVKQAIIDGWNWIKQTFDNNPILNVLLPIIPLIRLVIYLIENWETVVDTAATSIKNKFESLKNTITGLWDSVGKSITDTFNKAMEFLGLETRINSVSEGVTKAVKTVITPEHVQQIQKTANNTWDPSGGMLLDKKWSGGYAGNGGKYEPKGIYHGGEYIMTKEATSRLGVPLLNALNYGKKAVAASMLGLRVAAAQPANIQPITTPPAIVETVRKINIATPQAKPARETMQKIGIASEQAVKIDNRPPLAARQPAAQQTAQPITVNITINAAQGQDERAIARLVAQEIQRAQNKQQAKLRSRMTDNE